VLPPLNKARTAFGVSDALERAGEAGGARERGTWWEGGEGEAPGEAAVSFEEFWAEPEEEGPSLEFLMAATRQPPNRMVDGVFLK
jgi:hypothetical protein